MTLPNVMGLATAIGLGLLIGLVRERGHNGSEATAVAGLRTHALLALLGAMAITVSVAVLSVLLAGIALLTAVSYRRSSAADPGLTGEVAVLLTPILGAVAISEPALAAALGVVIAGLLQAKSTLHRFSRELLTEAEVHDGLALLASALVILPLLPDVPIDPWGVLRPQAVWRLVVLVMGVGMIGHIALRAIGARWGLPVAGFFAGFVSSTAVVASYGSQAREQPESTPYAVTAALLANLASLILMALIVGSLAPALLVRAGLPLAAAAVALLVGAALGLSGALRDGIQPPPLRSRSFRVSYALLLAVAITAIALLAAIAQARLGTAGAITTAALAALAEWHAAAAGLAQLAVADALSDGQAAAGLVLLLITSTVAKTVIAFASGGKRYGYRVGAGLLFMVLGAVVALWLSGGSV